MAASKKNQHSEYTDLVPMDLPLNMKDWSKPNAEECAKITEKTKLSIEKKLQSVGPNAVSAAAASSNLANKAPTFIKYTPHDQSQSKLIKLVEMQKDPMEPPKYGFKRLPPGPPSPPAPVMHSPPRKLTQQEKDAWKIPPCISNWKNAKGYTIPLDKRLAADGRGLQVPVINDQFAKLSEALMIADRHTREELRQRAAMQQKIAEKEKALKDEHLRSLAQKAREERTTGISGEPVASTPLSDAASGRSKEHGTHPNDAAVLERDAIRKDTLRQLQRDYRLSQMGQETKAKHLKRMGERDISEKIALGVVKPTVSSETMFDSRLFNQTEGLSSGFGDEEAYAVYDQPLLTGGKNPLSSIYRPKAKGDEDMYGGSANTTEMLQNLLHVDKFERGKHFQGAGNVPSEREGPVEFEKEVKRSVDPFGLDDFMSQARKGKPVDSSSKSSSRPLEDDEGRSGYKRQRRG